MSGIVKAIAVGVAAVFASEFAGEMEALKEQQTIAKYGGAAAGAYLALKLL